MDDNSGSVSNSATITITVNSVNDSPVANDDSGITNKNVAITLPAITSNDTDVDGTVDASTADLDPSTAGKQTTFTNAEGTWTVNASGDVTYTPLAGFFGTTSITYTVKDNAGAISNQATLSMTVLNTVTGGNVPPVANNDNGSTNEDIPITLSNVTSNDTDADGTVDPATVDLDPLTAGQQTTFINAEGTWSVNASGDVTYSPALNFNGVAIRNYTVNDNAGATSGFTSISITVNPVNDEPIANNDSGTTTEDTPVTLPNITSDDTDADGTVDASTVDLDPSTGGKQTTFSDAQGTWNVNASGDVTYTPSLNFNGSTSRSYTVNDNSGTPSNVATINISVTPVNDVPIANNENGSTPENIPLSLPNITANDSDIDGTIDVATVDLDPQTAGKQSSFTDAQGTWNVNASGNLSFTPASNYNGIATRTYTVNDNSGATSNIATISITVTPVNNPPVANNDSGATNEDTPVVLPNITSNDTDVDGTVDVATVDLDPITAGKQINFANAQGTWGVNASGDLSFTPAANFNGITSRTYTVNDNTGAVSNTGIISITVNAVNDMPILKDLTVTTIRNTPISGNIMDPTDNDPDGTALTINTLPINPPDYGTLLLNSSGAFTYTPNLNFVGSDLIEVQICDNGIPLPADCSSKFITIVVNPSNNAPVIIVNGIPGGSLTASTLEDTPVIFCFEAVDPDGDDITVQSITRISGSGSISIFGNIQFCFQYAPALNFYGTSVYQIQVCDNGIPSLCGTLTATITVIPVNDPPVAVRDTIRTLRANQASINLLTNDFDVEGDAMTMSVTPVKVVMHGQAELMANGAMNYVSDRTFRGIDSLQYSVCDSGVPTGCSTGTVIIVVDDLPLKVYEGVSPNGDGNNDYLRIDGIDYYVDNEVTIIDRYNNQVWQVRGYDNQDKVWRGQANKGIGPSELPEETYFYIINLGDGSTPLKGFIVLKRN